MGSATTINQMLRFECLVEISSKMESGLQFGRLVGSQRYWQSDQIEGLDEILIQNAELVASAIEKSRPVVLTTTGSSHVHLYVEPLLSESRCTFLAIYTMAQPSQSVLDQQMTGALLIAPPEHSLAMSLVDRTGKISFANKRLLKLLGFDRVGDIIGLNLCDFWYGGSLFQELYKQVEDTGEWHGQLTAKGEDGIPWLLQVHLKLVRSAVGEPIGYELTCFDPLNTGSDQNSVGDVMALAGVALFAVNENGTIIHGNMSFCRMFGYTAAELIGKPIDVLLDGSLRERHQGLLSGFFTQVGVFKVMTEGRVVEAQRKNGEMFPVEISLVKHDSPSGSVVVATVLDVSDKKQMERDLRWQATHDPLTRLPNRAMVKERLEKALRDNRDSAGHVAVLFVDLDNFKLINDSYGHSAGDQLLVQIADRLRDLVRPQDTVGRFGGDEFVVVCDHINTIEDSVRVAERIVSRLKEPFFIDGVELFATASIGVTVSDDRTQMADDLLKNADAAMYKTKDVGRNGWVLFNDDIRRETRMQLDIVNGLQRAIHNNEMFLVFQPIIDLRGDKIAGVEVLLRWQVGGKLISPADFIPIAERFGFIVPIGEWVFEQACQALREWTTILGDPAAVPYLSINLSARQLQEKNIEHRLLEILDSVEVDPRKIVLEITETSLIKDIDNTLAIFNRLNDRGIALAVDDFGTGYSSLSQLARLPVQAMKVDKAFIQDIETSVDNASITRAIVHMAHALNLEVVAEGVENQQQLQRIRDIGCDKAQGFYLCRPIVFEDMVALLTQRQSKLFSGKTA